MSHASALRRQPTTVPTDQRPADAPWLSSPRSTRFRTRQGESALVALLQEPPIDWAIFPAGPNGPVFEHLVVGPGGVFTLTTRHSDGEWVWVDKDVVWVSGRRMAASGDAIVEADRVSALLRARIPLRVPVRPLIALLGARFIVVRGRTPDLNVVDARELHFWLLGLSPVLRPAERMELAAVIDNPVTWGARASVKRAVESSAVESSTG